MKQKKICSAAVYLALLMCISFCVHQFWMQHRTVTKTQDAPSSPHGRWNEIFRYVLLGHQKCGELVSPLKTIRGDEYFSSSYLKAKKQLETYLNEKLLEGDAGSFDEQRILYWQIAQTSSVKTICETGFNAGQSALLLLHANPQAHVYSFDIGSYPYTKRMAEYLLDRFPGRLTVTLGDSRKTLPRFHANHSDVKCDVVIVDGGHSEEVATADIRNFKQMASLDHIFVIDDHPCKESYCKGPGYAFEKYKQQGEVIEYFGCYTIDIDGDERGLTVGRYT